MNTKNLKLTPWFPNSIKPVRVGVYEIRNPWPVKNPGKTTFRYWNGQAWGLACSLPSLCRPGNYWKHGENMTGWRGIEK